MAAHLGRAEIYRLAHMGAEARLAALDVERADILRRFPDLGGDGAAVAAAPGGGPGRRRSRMSAARRKAVSTRMKKYWTGRRKGGTKR